MLLEPVGMFGDSPNIFLGFCFMLLKVGLVIVALANSPADKVAELEKIANKAVLVLFEPQQCLDQQKKSPPRGRLGENFF